MTIFFFVIRLTTFNPNGTSSVASDQKRKTREFVKKKVTKEKRTDKSKTNNRTHRKRVISKCR